jgi:hypothetical protein
MTNEVNEMADGSRGAAVMAYAVIDDEGVQHSLWFLEKDATSEAAMVGGTVVRLGHPTLTDEEREAIEKAIGRELDAEWYGGPEPGRVAALRGLLRRLD